MSALNAGLSQFPSAIGVMVGSQLASRVIYWRLGPRRHLTLGLCGVALFIALLALMGAHTSLWWARLILFGMGFSMSQVFVPAQAASFATISPADTGRASTLYNASRQLGGAIGVALLTTTIVIVGPVHLVAGHAVANLTAYRVSFLVAAACARCSASSHRCMIRDADAAQTMVDPATARNWLPRVRPPPRAARRPPRPLPTAERRGCLVRSPGTGLRLTIRSGVFSGRSGPELAEVPDGRAPTAARGNRAGPLHRLGRCRALSALLYRGTRRHGGLLRPGELTYVALANTFIIINVGGGPTDDKPTVTLEAPAIPTGSAASSTSGSGTSRRCTPNGAPAVLIS